MRGLDLPVPPNTTQEQGAALFNHISDEEEAGNFMIPLLLETNGCFSFGPEELCLEYSSPGCKQVSVVISCSCLFHQHHWFHLA